MMKSKASRIVARKLARELTAEEIEHVAGAGGTTYYDRNSRSYVGDTNYS
jgi:hypothetical protein